MEQLKAVIHEILLYFLKVFAEFGYATDDDVAGFEAWVEEQKAAE